MQAQRSTRGTMMASQTMVSFVTETLDWQTLGPQEGPFLPVRGQHLASISSSHTALGLSTELNPSLKHCDSVGLHTISNARASSTRHIYASCWKLFSAWCQVHGLDPAIFQES